MVIARAVVHLATEMGFNVPRDLSVTSWGWHLTAQEQIPPLSTMELDYRLMMERGFELLNRLIEKDAITESKIVVALKYVEGATVAPPAK
jgi:LacI family transcriptional regulator